MRPDHRRMCVGRGSARRRAPVHSNEGSGVGKRLVTSVDGVILTGSAETAAMFQTWKPDLRLFAETSGKNALIITPHADIDLAVADLVTSAFGHAGQKCSAASLAICVGDVYGSPRFRRQLVDAVESLVVGSAAAMSTTIGPTIAPVEGKLERGLTTLDEGEQWLVVPELLDDEASLWRPGVRVGVQPASWFHRTECFGPVLGVMRAATLDEAIEIQNSSAYGLTGGIHTLDPRRWTAGSVRCRSEMPTSIGRSPAPSCSASRSGVGSAPTLAREQRRADRTTSCSSAHGCQILLLTSVH